MVKKIKFKIVDEWICRPDCPFGKPLRLGSIGCSVCKYNEGVIQNELNPLDDHVLCSNEKESSIYDLLKQAEKLCQKFITKVEDGRARSVETYADCTAFIDNLKKEHVGYD